MEELHIIIYSSDVHTAFSLFFLRSINMATFSFSAFPVRKTLKEQRHYMGISASCTQYSFFFVSLLTDKRVEEKEAKTQFKTQKWNESSQSLPEMKDLKRRLKCLSHILKCYLSFLTETDEPFYGKTGELSPLEIFWPKLKTQHFRGF